MDYGKLAYLKADDINKRVDNLERRSKGGLKSVRLGSAAAIAVSDGFWTEPMKFSSGSDNSLTVLMKLRFEHSEAANITISAEINGVLFHTEDVRLGSGVTDYFAIAVAIGAKDYNNSIRIGLEGDGYLGTLVSYDAIVWGDSVDAPDSDVIIAVLDGKVKVAAANLGGDVVCWMTDGIKFAFGSAPMVIATGIKDFDMATDYYGRGLCIVTVDAHNSLKLLYVSPRGKIVSQRQIMSSGVSSASIITYLHSPLITIGYVTGGKLKVVEIDERGNMLGQYDNSGQMKKIESVRAVNGAEKPVFLIKTEDNRVFVKSAKPFFLVNESVVRNNVTVLLSNTAWS